MEEGQHDPHWTPDLTDVTKVRNTLENAGMGREPRDATNIIGCGVEAGIRSGMTTEQVRRTVDTALDRFQGTREPVGSSER